MAQQVKKCVSTQLIDGYGNFNADGMKKFAEDVKLAGRGLSYGVVSIIGPQSSGKSTLLNHLFGTDFKEMDARLGRLPTTRGVCLAQSPWTKGCLLVLDTEGSDGAEREDKTTFERQTALFDIATSEIVMINMWYHDVGRHHAANWPLLTIVFEVMLRIVMPRKVHLTFVLRDKGRTPLEILKGQLMKQLEKIWKGLPKPPDQVNTALCDRFKIEVVALPFYHFQKEQFDVEVATLRKKVVCSLASSEITTNRDDASAFTLNTKMIWDRIKENKDLDLPSQKVMVAEIRCDQIIEEKCQDFRDDLSWIKVKNKVESSTVVQGFGETGSELIDAYLSKYDTETQYFDEGVRAAKRKQLNEKMLQVIEPTYRSLLERIRVIAMEKFKDAIVDGLHKENCLEEIAQYQIERLLNEMRGRFEDAAIKQANWNDATTELERLRGEMSDCIIHSRRIIEENRDNVNRDNVVMNAVKIGGTVGSIVLAVLGFPFPTGG